MPSRRDTGRARGRKRSAQVMEAAEDVLPTVVRSFLRVGLTPDALQELFERTIGDWREQGAPSSDGEQRRQPPGYRRKGNDRSRAPVAAKTAFATAGATGGTPGSPTPPGGSPPSTIRTSISGISE